MNIIALNGWPKAGKSEVARILQERYGAVIVDDGMILRQAAPILFQGVEFEDTLTQEGKAQKVEINGTLYTVRQALGFLGQCLEDFFGEDYVADQTAQRIEKLPRARYYVLPSVRKSQGRFYRDRGGKVFEVDRDVPESSNAFDQWDTDAVHDTIRNWQDIPFLEDEVARIMFKHFRDPGLTRLITARAA